MAKQRTEENSLFLSLREVQSIVEDRVREEEEAKQRKVADEVRAREDAIRRVQEEEEARIRAEEDRVRMEREARERQHREDELRLQEAERRAHIGAQAGLEEARIRAEAHAIANKPMPWGWIAAVTTILLLVSGGVIGLVVRHNNEAKIADQLAADQRFKEELQRGAEERKKLVAEEKALQAQLDVLNDQYNKAKTADERRRLDAERKDAAIRTEKARVAALAAEKAGKERAARAKLKSCKDSSDPLCGVQ